MRWGCDFADMSPHRNQSMAHRGAIGEQKKSPGGNGVAGIQWGQLVLAMWRTLSLSSGGRNKAGGTGTLMMRRTEGLGVELHPCAVPVWGREMDMSLDDKRL